MVAIFFLCFKIFKFSFFFFFVWLLYLSSCLLFQNLLPCLRLGFSCWYLQLRCSFLDLALTLVAQISFWLRVASTRSNLHPHICFFLSSLKIPYGFLPKFILLIEFLILLNYFCIIQTTLFLYLILLVLWNVIQTLNHFSQVMLYFELFFHHLLHCCSL